MQAKHSQAPLPHRMETRRLIVRRYERDDVAWFHTMAHRNRSHLARYEAENFVMGIERPEDAVMVIEDLIDAWAERSSFFFGAFLKTPDGAEDTFVGQIYVGPVNWDLPEIEVGYFVDAVHERHGYVTEALRAVLGWIFNELGAHRIRLECDDTNCRSAAVAERCGFSRDAHLRENKRNPDGSITGTLIYGLLRRDYESTAAEGPASET